MILNDVHAQKIDKTRRYGNFFSEQRLRQKRIKTDYA